MVSVRLLVAVACRSPRGRARRVERPCCHPKDFDLCPAGSGSPWRVLTGTAEATVTQVVAEVMATESPIGPAGALPEISVCGTP